VVQIMFILLSGFQIPKTTI